MANYTLSAIFKLNDRFSGPCSKIKSNMKTLGISADSVGRKIEGLSGKLSKIGSVGVKAFKGIALGAGALGIAGTKVAMDFEALSARMDTAFKGDKKKAKEYYAWANKFANETPFSNEEVVGVTAKLAMQGYDPKKLMTVIGDMAGAMGAGLDQAYEAFDDVSRGEWARLKTLGIDKSEVEKTLSEKGWDNVINAKGQIVDKQKAMDALIITINKKYRGGMEAMAKTLKGKVSTAVGNFKFAVANAMGVTENGSIRAGSAIERIKEKLDKLNNYLTSEKFQASLKKWGEVASKAFGQIGEIGKKMIEYFKINFPTMFGDSLDKLENFDPTMMNKGLDSIIKNFDKMLEKLMRVTGAWLGFQLGMAGGIKGAVIGAGLGLFSPEIMKGIEAWQKFDKETTDEEGDAVRKDLVKKRAEEARNYEIQDAGEAFMPGQKSKTNFSNYGSQSQMQKLTEYYKRQEMQKFNIVESFKKRINSTQEKQIENINSKSEKKVEITINMNGTINGGMTAQDVASAIKKEFGNLSDNLNLGGAF